MGTQDQMQIRGIGKEILSPKGIDPFFFWGSGLRIPEHVSHWEERYNAQYTY